MSSRAKYPGMLVLSVCFLLLFGCGREDSPLPQRDWNTLYRHLTQDPTTLDPAQVKDVDGGRIIAHVYGMLVTYDAEGRLVGDVAESWNVSDGGTTYTFRLRKGLKFANGRSVTSQDVVNSFSRTLSPATESPRTWVLDRIKGAKGWMAGAKYIEGLRAPDPLVVIIELETPFAPFLGLLTMPAAAVIPAEVEDFNQHGFGTGPFRVASFEPGERLVLERNPHYQGAGPYVDRVVYRIIEPALSRIAHFERGEIDVMDVPGDYYEKLAADPATRDLICRTESANVYFIGINCTAPRFRDRRVREGLAHALDVDALVRALLPGRATPARGPIPPALPEWVPGEKGLGYDPELARRLLREGGFDASQPVRFLCGSDRDTVKICQVLAGELEKVGVKVALAPRERGTFKQMIKTGDFDLYYYSWWADYFDAENFLTPLFRTSADRSGGNPTGYSNTTFDAIMDAACTSTDPASRGTFYRKARDVVLADVPRIWLWHKQDLTLRQPWVENYSPSAIYNTDKGDLIRIVRPAD